MKKIHYWTRKETLIVLVLVFGMIGFTAGYFVGTNELVPTTTDLMRSLETQNSNAAMLAERLNSCSAKLKQYVEYVEAQK